MRVNPRVLAANSRLRRRASPDQLPLPPARLIFLVAGSSDIAWFLRGGALAAESLSELLVKNGASIDKMDAILDFGCGCGRVLRHWRGLTQTRVSGSDYNRLLVQWCQENLSFADVRLNRLSPPLDFDDAQFDLVYAFSVFTHLTPNLQLDWIKELARVLKPGGYVVVSTHGDSYSHRLKPSERRLFDAGQLVVKDDLEAPGHNTCAAYHPVAYVRDVLASGLEVVDFVPEGARGNPRQDMYLIRKPRAAEWPTLLPQPPTSEMQASVQFDRQTIQQ
jgi:SAM-dependent methyltransferase